MALDLLREESVGETEETFGLKCVPAGYLVSCLAQEAGVCLDEDHRTVMDRATFEVGKGLLVRDAYGRTFRLDVKAELVEDAGEDRGPWCRAFRKGFLPALWRLSGFSRSRYVKALRALATAVASGDKRLRRGDTVLPAPVSANATARPECACLVGLTGWLGGLVKEQYLVGGEATVEGVSEFFASMCFEMDQNLREPAACRWLLNWFDETPPEEAATPLLREIDRALSAPEQIG